MLIASDVDGVGTHWDRRFDAWKDESYPHLVIPRHGERTFTFHKELGKEETEACLEIMNRPGFYADLEEIEGWRDALRRMKADGHHVILLTSA